MPFKWTGLPATVLHNEYDNFIVTLSLCDYDCEVGSGTVTVNDNQTITDAPASRRAHLMIISIDSAPRFNILDDTI